jgi:oligoendopeptidase F
MAVTYTKRDVLSLIDREVRQSSLRKVAQEREIHHSQLCNTLNGKVEISEAFARAFGFEMTKTVTITFRKAS